MSSYKDSGVDIDLANQVVGDLTQRVRQTYSPNVMGGLGHFGAFYALPTGYKEPVLVSCTDGVGTKLKLAIAQNQYQSIGIDLVAMCVNDLICSGAKPLFFLDYYACCKLNKMQLNALMDGMISACQDTGLSLVGGEIAEMGDCYRNNEFDLAGFCVGVVEKSAMITGQSIASGQYVYGLKSNGLHANGFSLVRRVLTESVCQERGIDPADLLAPTALYVQPIQALMAAQTVTGIAHITGGGLAENIARILPKHVSAILKKSAWTVPSIFEHIQLAGQVSDSDMLRTFNMGIGMVVITPTPISDPNYSELGYIVDGNGTVEWAP